MPLPVSAARQEAFLARVRREVPALTLDDDALLELGAGLALSALNDEHEFTRAIAEARGIPGLLIDTVTAAALSSLYPASGLRCSRGRPSPPARRSETRSATPASP